MRCVQLSEGFSRWFSPSARGPGHPELSKSYMDMASKLLTFTPSAGCDALCVKVLGGHPPGGRVRAGASLCT